MRKNTPKSQHLTPYSIDLSRVIEMAWEDRTPFEAIQSNFGLNESQVIRLMRTHLKSGSFRLWRKRVTGRATKHLKLRHTDITRAYCKTQYSRVKRK